MHLVKTKDCYLLEVHRIPHGKTNVSNGEVAYLQHCLECSSADYLMAGPGKSLGM